MITKGLAPFSGIKAFAIMKDGHLLSASAAGLGLAVVALPLAWAPGWAYAVALFGAVAVLAAAFAGWRQGPAFAAAAAITCCAFTRAGTLVLAAEGLLILAYLLAAHAPAGLTRPGAWLRHQAFGVVAGVIASGAVLAVLALHQVSSAWLTAAGLAAAIGAYLVALPLGRLPMGRRLSRQRLSRQQLSLEPRSLPRKRSGTTPSAGASDVDVQ
jgi:hypothetical protein